MAVACLAEPASSPLEDFGAKSACSEDHLTQGMFSILCRRTLLYFLIFQGLHLVPEVKHLFVAYVYVSLCNVECLFSLDRFLLLIIYSLLLPMHLRRFGLNLALSLLLRSGIDCSRLPLGYSGTYSLCQLC